MGTRIDISVVCITYNHEKYIKSALDGFLRQKGNFTYEIIVHDDASTDRTPEILKEYQERYPDKIRLILQRENQFSKKKRILLSLLPEIQGKYFAICEGDDEWTYEDKLQKQFEWMEAHPDTRLCLHNAIKVNNQTEERGLLIEGLETGFLTENEIFLCEHGCMPTASFFLRKEEMQNLPDYLYKAPVGDDLIRYRCAANGQIYYINEAWCIRNYMHEGSWNKTAMDNPVLFYQYAEGYMRYLSEFNLDSNRRFEGYVIDLKKSVLSDWVTRRVAQELTCKEFEDFIRQKSREYDLESEDMLEMLKPRLFPNCVDYDACVKKFLLEAKQKKGKIYLYGAGKIAEKRAEKLWEWGFVFDGFVVSKKTKEQEYLGYNVWELGELSDEKDNCYFWLGMNETNKKEVLPVLKEIGYRNILV